MPRRLRPLFAWAVVPVVAAVAVQAGYTLVTERRELRAGLETKAASLSRMTVDVVGPSLAFDDPKAVREGLGYVSGDADFAFASAVGSDGRATSVGRADPDDDVLVAAQPVFMDGKQLGVVRIGLQTARVHRHAMWLAVWEALISLAGMWVAIFIVRGLVRRIAARNDQMRLVLDHVDEALATIRPDGTLAPECSEPFRRWFGVPGPGHFAAQLAPDDARLRAMLELAWTEMVDGQMPMEVLVAQFPSRLDRDGKHFRIDVTPRLTGEQLVGALVRVRDVTDEVETHRSLAAQREYVAVFERALADPIGVREFVEDTGQLVADLGDIIREGADDERDRTLHTIKGNAAVYGVDSVARAAHHLEDHLAEGGPADRAALAELVAAWSAFAGRVQHLLGTVGDSVAIPRKRLAELVEMADCSPAATKLRELLLEPVDARLHAFRAQVARIADRVGKPVPEIAIITNGLRIPPERLRGFWGAFGHVLRNAIDHGIESPAERVAAGKPERGLLELRASGRNGSITIEVSDDGRGIQWERLAQRAAAAGLPCATRADLERALFSNGLTTSDAVSEVSGRGIGLAAVEAETRAAGGTVEVISPPGGGARFVFTFAGPNPVRAARRTRPMHFSEQVR